MTAFLTADGEPFYAGTYFRLSRMRHGMPSFRQLLEAVSGRGDRSVAACSRRPRGSPRAGRAHRRRWGAAPLDARLMTTVLGWR